MWSFAHSTRTVLVGPGVLAEAAKIAKQRGGLRPALVLDPWFVGGEAATTLAAQLAEACGTAPAICPVLPGEPDLEAVEALRAMLHEAAPDCIVVLGGGSAMDAAKVARMLLANPGPPQAIAGPTATMHPHHSLFMACPTTAGTGSEVSESAVIAVRGGSYKMIFRSQHMTPEVALLDPIPGATAPASVTAASGLDAVTHAVEAFWSRAANPITDLLAREAMRLLAAALPRAYDTPGDLEAREHALVGSMLAAMAFNSANLGAAHALSGALGALHHTPHGLANALALPHVARFNEPATPAKAAEIAAIFGGPTAGDALATLQHRLGLATSLDTLVPPEALDAVADGAMASFQLKMNPRPTTRDDIRALLEAMRLQ